ncbi:MAG: alpha-L-fucosidase [Actinobacteria bacterium]|nr:alpha-L-fucosidase [Actinomycetota bacterium]
MIEKKWFETIYRRNLIDMHIEDWNDEFLSKLDPSIYMEMLKISGTQTAMVYANSHVGYCYWPTKTGLMHKCLKGRDIFGEIVSLCHKENLIPLAYYSVIYNNWAYENNPSWRMLDIDGLPSRERRSAKTDKEFTVRMGRYGLCCPNSFGYKKFTMDQLEELANLYDFKGMFFDMTFWPMICYCDSCKKRYYDEVGSDIPLVIDWRDKNWLTFQSKREEWLYEFTLLVSNTIKALKPDVTIETNYGAAMSDWTFGVTEKIGNISDYSGGDFYGGFSEQSFVCKLYYNLTTNQPFEYMTFVPDSNPSEETTLKSTEMLKMHNLLAFAHSGAFLFIDAIDPIGTLDKRSFEKMGKVFNETKYYEQYLGGEMVQDAAIYFSFSSKMNYHENGQRAQIDWTQRTKPEYIYTHLYSVIGASKILKENHIPLGIISINQIDKLSSYKILVLPNVLSLNKLELEKIYEFLENGGSLYASGELPKEFLKKVFGIETSGITRENITYMTPTDLDPRLLYDSDKNNPMTIRDPQVIAGSANPDSIIAKLVLPYTDPNDEAKFSSIHSNPPGINTEHASIVYSEFGKGKAVWISYPIEKIEKIPHKKTFVNLIKKIFPGQFSFSSEVSKDVEIILFDQPQKSRFIVNIINEQSSLPPVPVCDFKVILDTASKKITKVMSVTHKEELNFTKRDNSIEIQVPKVEMLNMIAVDYCSG